MQRLKTMRSAFTLLATALLLPVPVVRAQITRNITDGTTPPGIAPRAPAGSYRLSDLDNINLYSGNLNFRLKQIAWTAVTVFLTAWFCTMGPVAAVLALVVAKHVLVAILLMGMGLDRDARR